jgi:hypothetical protein
VIRHVEIGGDMRAFVEILGELGVELAYLLLFLGIVLALHYLRIL